MDSARTHSNFKNKVPKPKTYNEVNGALLTFERRRYEDIASYMDRYEEILKDMQCVDANITPPMADQRALQHLIYSSLSPI